MYCSTHASSRFTHRYRPLIQLHGGRERFAFGSREQWEESPAAHSHRLNGTVHAAGEACGAHLTRCNLNHRQDNINRRRPRAARAAPNSINSPTARVVDSHAASSPWLKIRSNTVANGLKIIHHTTIVTPAAVAVTRHVPGEARRVLRHSLCSRDDTCTLIARRVRIFAFSYRLFDAKTLASRAISRNCSDYVRNVAQVASSVAGLRQRQRKRTEQVQVHIGTDASRDLALALAISNRNSL